MGCCHPQAVINPFTLLVNNGPGDVISLSCYDVIDAVEATQYQIIRKQNKIELIY